MLFLPLCFILLLCSGGADSHGDSFVEQVQKSAVFHPDVGLVLPDSEERSDMRLVDREARYAFWGYFYVGTSCVAVLILEILTRVAMRSEPSSYDLGRQDSREGSLVQLKQDVQLMPPGTDKVSSGFMAIELAYLWYQTTYMYFCAGLVIYACQNDYLDADCGLDFEVYVPWFIQCLFVHFCCTVYCIQSSSGTGQLSQMKKPYLCVFQTLFPFVSAPWNSLRDWITMGIYISAHKPLSYFSAGIVFLSIVIVFRENSRNPDILRSCRRIYWPLAELKSEASNDTSDYSASNAAEKAVLDLISAKIQQPATLHRLWLKIISEMDQGTREHKRNGVFYGDIPQAIAAVVFTLSQEASVFVVLSFIVNAMHAIVQYRGRPWALSWVARGGKKWTNVTKGDLLQIMASRSAYVEFALPFFPRGADWRVRAKQAVIMISEMQESPSAIEGAIEGLGNLYKQSEDDPECQEEAGALVNFLMDCTQRMPELAATTQATILELLAGSGLKEEDLDKPVPKAGGNLGYLPTGVAMNKAEKLIRGMSEEVWTPKDWQKKLNGLSGDSLVYATKENEPKGEDMVICFSDLEPDDSMAIAQLWQWYREKFFMRREPMIVFPVDFTDKDKGTVFQKKVLMTQLMLGMREMHILTPCAKSSVQGTGKIADYWHGQHETELTRVCDAIRSFEGERIHLFIMGPGRGNLGAIVAKLKSMNAWNTVATKEWHVHLYSGGFNMKNMETDDVDAIKEFARLGYAKHGGGLVDAAKFLFFGGKKCHDWTDSFTTFAPEQFSSKLNLHGDPLLIAFLKLLNDEHNLGLVKPDKLFQKRPLSPTEQARFDKIRPYYSEKTVQEYCDGILKDFALFAKVPDFKKSIVTAFAFGCCDSPLCDQLLFLIEWLKDRQPDALDKKETGTWQLDDKGFTMVKDGRVAADGAAGVQPVLHEPLNEEVLSSCRNALQEYLLRHLRSLQPGDDKRQRCYDGRQSQVMSSKSSA